jgi:hypothetical protein
MEPYKYVCKYLDALHSGNWEKAEEYLSCARKLIAITIPTLDTIDPNVRLYTNVCRYLDALHSGKWELAEKYLSCAKNIIEVIIPVTSAVEPNISLYMNTCSYLDALHSGKWELSEKYLDCARRSYDILFGNIVLPGIAQNILSPLLTNQNQPILASIFLTSILWSQQFYPYI